MKSNDFDGVAFIYDRLAQLIFGKSIIESQTFFLNKIPDHSKVLILGGGSGWILGKLFNTKPTVEVCYIEASVKMISRAKAILPGDKRIQFINGTEENIPNQLFNVAITNFYLDLFDERSLDSVLRKIKRHLTQNATWIATDFVNRNWTHPLMLKAMYIFFKVTSRIEANQLPNWGHAIEALGASKIESKPFFGKFIEAAYFQF